MQSNDRDEKTTTRKNSHERREKNVKEELQEVVLHSFHRMTIKKLWLTFEKCFL